MKYIHQIRLKMIAFQLKNDPIVMDKLHTLPLSLYFDIKPIGNSLD